VNEQLAEQTVHILRAQPIAGHGGVPTHIHIAREIPPVEHFAQLKDAWVLYQAEGQRLADALYDSLPGGTLDQLLLQLLQRRASLFHLPEDPK